MSKSLPKATGNALQHTSIVEQVVAQGQNVTLVPPSSVEDAKNTVISSEANALLQHVQAGMCYQYLKAELPHGEYLAFLKQIDVAQQRASERVAVANLYQKLTNSKYRTCGDLENDEEQLDLQSVPFSKMLALTKLETALLEAMPPEELKALVSSPTRAMQADIKQMNLTLDEQHSLENENHRLKAQVQTLQRESEHQINVYEHEKLMKSPEKKYGLHIEVAHSREKSVVIAEMLATAGVELNHLVQQCTNSALAPELGRDIALAVHTCVSGQIMQLSNYLKAIQTSFGVDDLTKPDNLPTYSEQEIHEAISNAKYATDGFIGEMDAIKTHHAKKQQKQ